MNLNKHLNYLEAINEKSFPSFKAWIRKHGGIHKFISEHDIHLDDVYQNTKNKKIKIEYLKDDLYGKFYDWIEKYSNLDFPLTLYRCVSLHKDVSKIKDIKGVGIYWSDSKENAECHWGEFDKGHENHILHATVKETDIDFNLTLRQNMSPNTGEQEQEITLKKNIPIKLIGIETNNKIDKIDFTVLT